MRTTDKRGCRMVAEALEAYGVREVVSSPGSRNVPLLMALSRTPGLRVSAVVDERSAAFIALGMARGTGRPVAFCCTSGSAMLNYGPALAEAFHSRVPLVAITADRPASWIDQADSQTIRQPGALPTVTKGSFSIRGEISSEEDIRHANRILNDALTLSLAEPQGPVQVNVELSIPLGNEEDVDVGGEFRKIESVGILGGLHNTQAREIASELAGRRVMVVCGPMEPDRKITRSLATFGAQPNAVVLADALSNIHSSEVLDRYELLLPSVNGEELAPDILISCGGALVSSALKSYLRRVRPAQIWHVGTEPYAIDTFLGLSRRIVMTPQEFFPKVANALAHLTRTRQNSSGYRACWLSLRQGALERFHSAVTPTTGEAPWNATAALTQLLEGVPSRWNLQLSNGMTVREVLLCAPSRFHRIDCNRGVSGIDGSVSTALGASVHYPHPTLLICGDMSFQYDLTALTSTLLTGKLKMVVMNNGGGGIFSYVGSSATLPERERLLQCSLRLPLEQLCGAWGIRYLKATDAASLRSALREFIPESPTPVLLEITTDPRQDAEALRELQSLHL